VRLSLRAAAWSLGVALAVGGEAVAAEVVWLSDPTPEDAARIAALAEARRGPLTQADLRGLLSAPTAADARAIAELQRVRDEVRVHETVLDGEKLILEAIERAIGPVTFVRDGRDLEAVTSALLYQGFAVERYFGPTLLDDPAAAPYRVAVGDAVVARPWVDAFALDPLRRPSESDIGEEPSRKAYEGLRTTLAQALRATLVVPDLPPESVLFVDGRPVVGEVASVTEVLPGLHFVHVELDGVIVARERVRLEPGQRFELQIPLPEPAWQDLVRAARAGEGVTPPPLLPFLERLGGELWVAWGRGDDLRVARVDVGGVRPVDVADTYESVPPRGGLGDVALATWIGAGVWHSPDFASAPPTGRGGEPLAVPPSAGIELAWDRAWLRYGLGVEVAVPLGADQVALSGPAVHRARPLAFVALGHPLLQVQAGYLFPHHRVGGLVASVPVATLAEAQEIELRAAFRTGAAPPVARPDGTIWQASRVVTASVSVGVRLRP
jgi:hypothetical protein